MNAKKKPVNGLLIVAIMAAAVWYGSYVQKNPFMGKQFETFVHMGQSLNDVESLETSTTGKFGYIKPQVVDGFSEEPIEGATVVIPETNTSYKTDEMGYTQISRIEIVPGIRFKNINPKPGRSYDSLQGRVH